jgi:hypothetical protein
MDRGTVVASSWSGVPIDWDGGHTTSIHGAVADEINVMPAVEFIPVKSGKGRWRAREDQLLMQDFEASDRVVSTKGKGSASVRSGP